MPVLCGFIKIFLKMKNRTSNSAQATYSRICKYGLSVILATFALTSCNKKEVTTTNGTTLTAPKSTARMLSQAEVDAIIDRTNNFVSYSNAWISNPATTIPQGILSELSDNDAVAYIEDAYNFVYTNRNINLIDTKSDDYNVTVPKNTNGKVAIANLAAVFANSMTHIRSVYNTVSGPKTLDNVDISVISTSNSNVVLHFKSFICSGALPLPVIPISGGGSTAISFSGGKQYNICKANKLLGINGDPTSAGHDATGYLIQALRANWTSSILAPGSIYATVGPLGGPRYKAINITMPFASTGGRDACAIPKDPSSNPWFAVHPCFKDHNALMFWSFYYRPCFGNNWIGDSAMNYSLNTLPNVFHAEEAVVGKSLWFVNITSEADDHIVVDTPKRVADSVATWLIMAEVYADLVDITLATRTVNKNGGSGTFSAF